MRKTNTHTLGSERRVKQNALYLIKKENKRKTLRKNKQKIHNRLKHSPVQPVWETIRKQKHLKTNTNTQYPLFFSWLRADDRETIVKVLFDSSKTTF